MPVDTLDRRRVTILQAFEGSRVGQNELQRVADPPWLTRLFLIRRLNLFAADGGSALAALKLAI